MASPLGFKSRQALIDMLERVSPLGELLNEYDWDHTSDSLVVRTTQDVEPILDSNKRLQADGFSGYSKSREMRHVATIPNIVVHRWLQEGINIYDPNATKAILRKLDDPEFRYLRTGLGRLA